MANLDEVLRFVLVAAGFMPACKFKQKILLAALERRHKACSYNSNVHCEIICESDFSSRATENLAASRRLKWRGNCVESLRPKLCDID
jgi:hypothetical protein